MLILGLAQFCGEAITDRKHERHDEFCREHLYEAYAVNVNGFLLDIRYAPREAQVAAFEKGLIPYIPADRVGEVES